MGTPAWVGEVLSSPGGREARSEAGGAEGAGSADALRRWWGVTPRDGRLSAAWTGGPECTGEGGGDTAGAGCLWGEGFGQKWGLVGGERNMGEAGPREKGEGNGGALSSEALEKMKTVSVRLRL